ncbi:MAG: RNA polymerase subunit sigma [Pseudomonadales bacterium RIFCSPLOWO2_12_60_38]|uniref:Sigma-70 family RNA polymerase sigma factor n=1 Tax=Pseudomonas paracarnis TaxID=2750625 RepID=A0ABU6C0J8_9PSED|nr:MULTISPECIES: sigma-70 family RNA polymerase sigma factor [Pseudomonas]AFJ55621.1 RNA polymerase sigma-70 factor, ECF subfamily, putative [Pseudomonas fluorescens A506]AOS74180.1 RNA polymerase subunit sigma [Pseudomonas fluorescens]ETK43513.1 RNA polymerase sigma factor [Pseudomonas fluorescens FH5]MDN5430011.1 sigma-70 family RNA polymerase sigma factor [Pseudomonadales bacterium]NHC54604.1 sigma-70 family RNA polymerase sigma factor [Pseudomonas sp. AU8050]NLT89535.1 sigma-70 family RNA
MAELIFDYQVCLLACARGDHRALHQLYEQDSSRLLGVALRITRNKALAEDIVHDAFIKIWHGAHSFDPLRGSARGWVFSVTRHLALDVVRSAGRDVPLDDQYEPLAEPAQSIEFAARSGQIHQCLERLDPTRRTCILHAYVDGYSHSEIAQKLSTPLGTVKAWIKRSLAALRECMA